MSRKPPKRATEGRAPPTSERLEELAVMIIDTSFELGPLDREDLREVLCETMRHRSLQRANQVVAQQEDIAA